MKTTIQLEQKSRRQLTWRPQIWPAMLGVAVFVSLVTTTFAASPWSRAVVLSKAAINAESPAAAISDTGAMAATWSRQQGSGFMVQASVNLNGTWTRGVNVSTGTEPAVAIDNTGVATVVWSAFNVTKASSLLPGGGWSPPVAISNVGTIVRSPRVVADAAGNLTAIWVRYDSSGVAAVETADRAVNGNWTAPVVLSSGAPDEISLVANASGDAAAIWSSFLTNAAVASADRPFGETWTTNTVAAPAYRQGGATVGIDADGNLTACWRTYTDIRVADKAAGGSWGSATTIYTNNAVSDLPLITKTASGDDMVAFVTYVFNGGGYNYQIRTSMRAAGGVWTTAAILTNQNEYDTQLHSGTTSGGSFVLTWVNNNTQQVKSSTRTITTGWTPSTVVTSGEFGTNLAVAGDTALVIWLGRSFQTMVSDLVVSP